MFVRLIYFALNLAFNLAINLALIWRIIQLLILGVHLGLDLAYILRAQKGQHESWWCPKNLARKIKILKKHMLICSGVFRAITGT